MPRVVSVTPSGKADVYNMEVDKHHNYSVSDGLIVHNCTYGIISHHVKLTHEAGQDKTGVWKVKERLVKQYKRKSRAFY